MKRKMKIIETNGIGYLEKLDHSQEWYWGTDYSMGDLYEAEEIYSSGGQFKPNRLIFVHFPDGKVVEPIVATENQYFERPAYIDGMIYILLVDFKKEVIKLFEYTEDLKEIGVKTEIPLYEVKDCYNLSISGSPVMVIRQGADNIFQIVWPERIEFTMGNRESFIYRSENNLYFSEWHEDEEYREEVNIRDYYSGKLIDKIDGTFFSLSNDVNWILR